MTAQWVKLLQRTAYLCSPVAYLAQDPEVIEHHDADLTYHVDATTSQHLGETVSIMACT